MIKKLLLFLVSIAFFSCDSTNENRCLSYFYSVSVDFYVLNTQGEDLLNPKNPNCLDVSKIKLFYIVNGVSQEYFRPNLDASRGFIILKPEEGSNYRIRIMMNDLDKSEKKITYVQWNEMDKKDIFESTLEITECYTEIKKVWFNGKLLWDRSVDEKVYPVLIK